MERKKERKKERERDREIEREREIERDQTSMHVFVLTSMPPLTTGFLAMVELLTFFTESLSAQRSSSRRKRSDSVRLRSFRWPKRIA
jgi:hypothetical protein